MSASVCSSCDFQLFNPVAQLQFSTVGLYDDARFPGRLLVVYRSHEEDFSQLPPDELLGYMQEIQLLMKALQHVTGSERVNLAVLGNAVPHVHTHLVPRYPGSEVFPHKSPWNDERALTKLDKEVKVKLIRDIRSAIHSVIQGPTAAEVPFPS